MTSEATERKRHAGDAISAASENSLDLGRLISGIEDERARIARELHDDVGQQLALVANELRMVHGRIPASEAEVRADVVGLYRRLADIGVNLNGISRRLHPSIVRHLGLNAAIRTECESFSRNHGIQVGFQGSGHFRNLPNHVSLGLYRITQEALRNIAKHSRAKTALVTLDSLDGMVCLRIKDSGRGRDTHELAHQPGLGLISMRERAKLAGGSFTFQSSPGKGTAIEVLIPAAKRPARTH